MPADERILRRTDQKLQYALVHLDELRARTPVGTNDVWENAHEESCFFHLVGAIENTFLEMNSAFNLGLAENQLTASSLKKCAKTNAELRQTFTVYMSARENKDEWLWLLYEIRNVVTHRHHHGKLLEIGGGPNSFSDPRTPGAHLSESTLETLARFAREARTFVDQIRKTYP